MIFKRNSFFITIGFFGFIVSASFAQDQKLADSLINLYELESYQGDKLVLLKEIAEEESNPDRKYGYAELLIKEAATDSVFEYLISGYLQKGNALHLRGEFDLALESYFKSIRYANRIKHMPSVGKVTISVANIYSEIGNSTNADIYYKKGIEILRDTDDMVPLAAALLNAGDEAFNAKEYEVALQYFEESSLLFKDLDYLIGTAYNKGNIGMVYAEQGKDDLAETNINEAIDLLEEMEDYYGISVYLTYMSDIYFRQNDFPAALSFAERSLELSTRHGLNNQISEANLTLSEFHQAQGDHETSYIYYKQHIVYRDSVINLETVQLMADQRTNYEVSQKQIEVDLLEQKRKNQRVVVFATIIALFLIGLLAIGQFRRVIFIRKTKQIIEEERDKSDSLLLNILPEETAKELKKNGKVIAKKYNSVSVLFTDFKGFTSYSEKLSPEALVETIGFYFSKFDAIIEKHGLEKIKTIGDAYMCAAGLQANETDHAKRMVKAAFEIAEFVEETKNDVAASERTFDIRIGINSGPVVAGVVGTKKFAYDIWGDTVNVASRMESMSEPGKVNISQTTYDYVKDTWDCEYRGEIEIKNRGAMKMYFVNA